MRIIGVASATFLMLFSTLPSWAQFNTPIRYNEGPGIKLSDSLVFHPGLAVEGSYDTNALYEETEVNGAAFLRVIGHLHLATLSPQRLAGNKAEQKIIFRLKTAASFREYLSGAETVKAQRALEIDAGLLLKLFPERMFSASIGDDFARTVTARNAETSDSFARDTNRATLGLKLTPGGGLLGFDLLYSFYLDAFEDGDLVFANKLAHELRFVASWKLMPQTAISIEAIQKFYSYYDKNGGRNPGYVNHDSRPLKVYAGLTGLITPKLSTVIKVGYGNSFHETNSSYNLVVGAAEVGYKFTPTSKLRAGYSHDFVDSMFANYFTDDAVFVSYDQLVAARFIIQSRVSYTYRAYEGFPPTFTVQELTHHLLGIHLGFDYQIKEWVYIGLGYDLQLKSIISGKDLNASFFANDYTKHQMLGKVGISY